jgi:competence protein ComGC
MSPDVIAIRGTTNISVLFEVLTTKVIMDKSVFWDKTPCGPFKVFEEDVTSIFRVEEVKQETRVEQIAKGGLIFEIEATCFSETSVDIRELDGVVSR